MLHWNSVLKPYNLAVEEITANGARRPHYRLVSPLSPDELFEILDAAAAKLFPKLGRMGQEMKVIDFMRRVGLERPGGEPGFAPPSSPAP